MRVLTLFGSRILAPRGTPSRARNLALALARLPDVEVIVVSGDPAAEAAELPLPHRSLSGGADPAAALAAAAAELAPDVIHGHTHKAMPWLARLPKLLPAGAGRPLCVVDLHGNLPLERWERRSRSLPRRAVDTVRAWRDERRWAPRMDGFTAVCETLADRARRWQRPTRVLWGGVDTELFRPQPGPPAHELPAAGGRLRIGYAGNFRPYQGVEYLLGAIERRLAAGADLELLLIGDLAAEPTVARRAQALGERLIAPGPSAYTEVPALLATADVLAVPRPAHRTALYGFPSKLPEYLALGKPVIATRVGEQSMIVRHREDGLLVAPGSVDELAAALAELEDGELRRRLGRAARHRAEADLTWDAAAASLLTFLRELTPNHAS